MRGLIFAAVVTAVAVSGCAQQDHLATPAFAGLSDVPSQQNAQPAVDPALQYVNSNKVLGAMAYHKVTGRRIDPSRLVGSD